jgi:hypothetical protein
MIPIADRLKGFGTLESLLSREILVDGTTTSSRAPGTTNTVRRFRRNVTDAPGEPAVGGAAKFYKMSNRRACDHLPIKLAQAGLRMEVSGRDRSISSRNRANQS